MLPRPCKARPVTLAPLAAQPLCSHRSIDVRLCNAPDVHKRLADRHPLRTAPRGSPTRPTTRRSPMAALTAVTCAAFTCAPKAATSRRGRQLVVAQAQPEQQPEQLARRSVLVAGVALVAAAARAGPSAGALQCFCPPAAASCRLVPPPAAPVCQLLLSLPAGSPPSSPPCSRGWPLGRRQLGRWLVRAGRGGRRVPAGHPRVRCARCCSRRWA